MKQIDSPGTLPPVVNDGLVRHIKWQIGLILLAGLAVIVFFSGAQSPSVPDSWLLFREEHTSTSVTGNFEKWNKWTTRAAEWELRRWPQDEEANKTWAGRQSMRKLRSEGSLWWDESAEQYFKSKLEKSQFPTNCSEAHWIAHYDFVAGLLSSVHMTMLPLFFAMVRGHPLVPMSEPKHHPAFDGCGPDLADRNTQCYFNVTNCKPAEDPRLSQIMAMKHDSQRTTWEEVLMEDEEFFSPGGFTVTQSWKRHTWETEVCVGSSSFSSFGEAYTYHKLALWNAMGQSGKVGVVTGAATKNDNSRATRTTRTCSAKEQEDLQDSRLRRVDMVMVSLMSSWMLNRMPHDVKLVADQIMSRYTDELGHPLWKSPVLAIHIRQTDKSVEDPYYIQHGIYRPIEDYALHMKQMEEEYGFQWPSIFLISDSGTARESFVTLLNGNDSAAPNPAPAPSPAQAPKLQQYGSRYLMYDWNEDDHLQEKFKDHTRVPKSFKHDMQIHFLASLYILEKIADHAIVTYSSNVGRFIGEIMTAKHRLAFPDRQGPFVTSLDYPWFWS